MEEIKVGIVEDDGMVRNSLVKYLERHPRLKFTIAVDSMEAFLNETRGQSAPPIDVLLLDIELPGMSGVQGILHVRQRYPAVEIIMLTTFEEDELIFEALQAGACSYLTKRSPLPEIREAIFTVSRGGSSMSPSIARKVATFFAGMNTNKRPFAKAKEVELTQRQQEIVQDIVEGLTYQKVATKRNIALDTVRDHIRRIYRMLEISSKVELIRKYNNGEI